MALEELSNEQLEVELEDLQRRVERLRVLYEQYFLGIEKTPPYNVQKDVVRIIHRLTHVRIHSTTLKYRLQGLIQRFNSHKSYWARTVRDIEEGRFRRQGVRVRNTATQDGLSAADHAAIAAVREAQGDEAAAEALRRRQARRDAEADVAENFLRQLQGGGDESPGPPAAVAAPEPPPARADAPASSPAPSVAATDPGGVRGISAEDLAARAAKLRELRERMARGGDASASLSAAVEAARAARATPPATASAGATASPQPSSAARPAPPAAEPARPAPPDPARQVFDRLIATKRQLNESTDGLSYETLRRTMERQADAIREKKGCRSVDFDVVVKDGKAFLKPVVRD